MIIAPIKPERFGVKLALLGKLRHPAPNSNARQRERSKKRMPVTTASYFKGTLELFSTKGNAHVIISRTTTSIAMLISILVISPAKAALFEYNFLANTEADSSVQPNHNLDVEYVIRFDSSKFTALNLTELNKSEHWIDNDISLSMRFGGQTAYLNEAIDPQVQYLSILKDPISSGGDLYQGGFIEIYTTKSEFLDIDFHPWSSFIRDHNLPFDPFVYGQLDVYDNQVQFADFYDLWVNGDSSTLTKYSTSTVPIPSSAYFIASGLLGLLGFRHARPS